MKAQETERYISSKKEENLISKSSQRATKTESCPKGPIVAAEDGGRLGNKAWEYAAVWSLSKLLNRPGYVPSSMLNYLSHIFQNLTLKTLDSISHCNLNFTKPLKRYQLTPLQTLPHKYGDQNLLLHKWMLLPEPVIKYRDQLRKEFKFLPILLKLVQNTYNNIKLNNKYKNITYIGVHVRRTDFKTWLPLKYNTNLINAKYFLEAMAWFRKKINSRSLLFLIISDDPDWCKKEITSHVEDAILVSANNTSPGQDLALLASCNHTIIDYGTYGEWGAFLSRGLTVSFGVDKYFNDIASKKLSWKIWKLRKDVRVR
jgi:galactoside 2-L-fucosyltransferase 1/2